MDIHRIEEFKITISQKKEIQTLLANCFPGYPKDRTYFKQLPHFRYLVYHENQLIGHLAVEHRIIAIDQQPIPIFGVVDICVDPTFRGKKIAASLLHQLEELGKENKIEFVILTASNSAHRLYLKNGYKVHSNVCRWLFISEHQTLGVKNRHLDDALWVKSIGEKVWMEGVVDFLGPVF